MQEIISPSQTPSRKTRRSYTKEFKARVVSECQSDGKSIAQVALEHQINANLIHKWCRQIEGTTCQPMVPVVLNTSIADNPDSSSLIEVVFGTATIRFYGAVDPQNAQAVLSALR